MPFNCFESTYSLSFDSSDSCWPDVLKRTHGKSKGSKKRGHALGNDTIFAIRHIRNLHGHSHPFLVEASDGYWYVVKSDVGGTGSNYLFNEYAGNALYRAYGLPVPAWKPILLTNQFIDENFSRWPTVFGDICPPQSGLAFGSRYLGGDGIRLLEVVPNSGFGRISNRSNFWLAWLIDICALHADSRQAVFQVWNQRLMQAVFIDHGHAFGGPRGDAKPHFRRPCYADERVYQPFDLGSNEAMLSRLKSLKSDLLWYQVQSMPYEWKTLSGFRQCADCLNRLENAKLLEEVVDTLREAVSHRQYCGNFIHERYQGAKASLLLTRMPVSG